MKNTNEILLGSHVSMTKSNNSLVGSVLDSVSYGSNCFMIYTGAPQNTKRTELDLNNVKQAHELMQSNNISKEHLIVHAPYIINLCSSKEETRNLAKEFLAKEIIRCESIGAKYLVLHPGSRLDQTLETGIKQIASGIDYAFKKSKNKSVVICLETMAGKGSEVGSKLEELKEIINESEFKDNLGICLDTCHLNDAGYDMNDFDGFLDSFQNIMSLDLIKVVHLNDSKNKLNSHKDRHENIGYGHIGFQSLCDIAHNKRLSNIVKILETPHVKISDKKSIPIYKEEIKNIKSKSFKDIKIHIV